MTSDQAPSVDAENLQGRVFRPANDAERGQAVDVAFDYRGDVTVELASGEMVTGYIFNRNSAASPPALDLFPRDRPGRRVIPYADVAAIALTGEDTASGKSWEAWVHKKESERDSETQQLTDEAKARGHL